MIETKTITLDGRGGNKETSDILYEINFTIQNLIKQSGGAIVVYREGEKRNYDFCSSWNLTIQNMTIDRTVANSLIELIRCFASVSFEDNHNIRFYNCICQHHPTVDMLLITALYVSNPALEIGKCVFLSSSSSTNTNTTTTTLALLGKELRYVSSTLRNLAIVEQGIDESFAISLGYGLSHNNTLQTLNLRNSQLIMPDSAISSSSPSFDAVLQPIANGLQNSCGLLYINLRFCKLRDNDLAILIKSLRPNIIQQLLLRGNFIRQQSMVEIATLLQHPNCTIHTLDLSRQYLMGQKKFPMDMLSIGLSQNCSLKYLDLMSNSLTDSDILILVNGISGLCATTTTTTTTNTTITSSDDHHHHHHHHHHQQQQKRTTTTTTTTTTKSTVPLENLILSGSNTFRTRGSSQLLQLVKNSNMTLTRIVIPVRYPKDIMIQEQINFYTNWNKCGRKFIYSSSRTPSSNTSSTTSQQQQQQRQQQQQHSTTNIMTTNRNTVAIGLWPTILERINNLDWNNNNSSSSNIYNPDLNPNNSGNRRHYAGTTTTRSSKRYNHQNSAMRPSLIYSMLRNSPVLLEH